MRVRLRAVIGIAACAIWRLPDNDIRYVRMTQDSYLRWGGRGLPTDPPHPFAEFLLAYGGLPLLDGEDNWPEIGDGWERQVNGQPRLQIAMAQHPGFGTVRHDVADPDQGRSQVTGFRLHANGCRVNLKHYDLSALPEVHPDPAKTRPVFSPLAFSVPNHRSVSYGSSTTAFDNATYPTSLTYAGPSISGSDTHLICCNATCYASTVTSVTHNGDTVTSRASQSGVGGNSNHASIWDRTAPDASGNTVVATGADTAAYVCSTSYATGVHQTVPRTDADQATATSTSASVTSTSTTDGMAFTALCIDGADTVSTADASVTKIYYADNTGDTTPSGAGDNTAWIGYEVPAGTSNTITHTITSSPWAMCQVTLAASAGGAETITMDKWYRLRDDLTRRKIGVVPSGTIGIKT